MEPQTQAAPPANVGIKTLAWIEVNKQLLLRAGVGALALIVVVAVFIQYQAGKETAASKALSEVRMPFNPSVPTEPGTADKLFKVASEYKGTKAAARAMIMSAGVLFTDGEFAQAHERFNALLQQYPESPWVADAHLGVAASLEAQGKTDDAVRKYEDLRKRFATAPIADDVKLALGRLYEEVIKNGPNSAAASEASLFQEAMVKRNPELAKLREPVVPPMPPPSQPPVQITRLTNQPAGTNRTMTLSNLMQRAGTNAMNAVTGAAPPQIKITPAPAAAQPAPAPAK
jgi:predicted negative regulator of RcsB-dependent stress response